ncbi:MAG: VIT1/CCC1 transporter family protein [Bacteroidetes bacterium]|nr:VIT1/CCC1 transporter family protein [Bacteroidota bacterium]MBS1942883.1 VIT1/CCC1 transporter family protein [Bacteroidota bacterium]
MNPGHSTGEQHFTAPNLIKDIVIGMADGLTVPFALAAGLSGAVASNGIIITAGVAEVVAGSIAMGLGGYLAGRTDAEHYAVELNRERHEVETVPELEKQEIRNILGEYGISKRLQDDVAEELSRDKRLWVDFMMRFELGLDKPDPMRARKSAFNIGASYVVGGLVPLSAYFITDAPHMGLLLSSIITVSFLFIFGYVKTKLTGDKPLLGAIKTTLIGVLAASAAFLIARWVS